MIAHAIFFYFFSIIAILSAIMVIASRNTVHSVLFLILDFISISCLFIMIGAEFLGMMMLIVYVGAVAVLFVFVVMLLNVSEQKLKEVKKYEKGRTLLQNVQEKADLSDDEIEKIEDKIYTKFDSVYDAFIEIGRNGIEIVKDLKFTKKITTSIEEICSKIKLPSVEIRGIMEITNSKSDGIEIIKKILLDVLKKDPKIDITYLGAPKYRLSITSEDFKSAEKSLKPIIAEIQTNIEKKKGSFKFTREDSKKTRGN